MQNVVSNMRIVAYSNDRALLSKDRKEMILRLSSELTETHHLHVARHPWAEYSDWFGGAGFGSGPSLSDDFELKYFFHIMPRSALYIKESSTE